MIATDLIAAYKSTHYQVMHPCGAFTLRVGQYSPELTRLFVEHQVTTAAFITACNPHSQPVDAAQNHRAQQYLANDLVSYVCYAGVGLDPLGKWEGEASFLVLGINLEQACLLGHRYQQNAIVWVEKDRIPLLWLLMDSDLGGI